jgi:peptidoglycan hydrolase CwlO-like protein
MSNFCLTKGENCVYNKSMKKIFITVGLIICILSLVGCSLIPQANKPATTTTKPATTTAPTLMDRIQALETQQTSLNTQIGQLQAKIASLQAQIDALK